MGIQVSRYDRLPVYHEVEVSTRFTLRGPQARGCVNRVGSDTEWYNPATCTWHGLRGPDNASTACNYSVGHNWGSSAYLETVQTICSRPLSIESDARRRWPRADAVFCPTLASSLTFRTKVLSSLCRKGRYHPDSLNPVRAVRMRMDWPVLHWNRVQAVRLRNLAGQFYIRIEFRPSGCAAGMVNFDRLYIGVTCTMVVTFWPIRLLHRRSINHLLTYL